MTEEVVGKPREGASPVAAAGAECEARFLDDDSYVDNFSFEWSVHRRTQLDSANWNRESEDRFAASMDFPLVELCDKFVLDMGCGTGRFAEVVLKHGETVVRVDLYYAVDATLINYGRAPSDAHPSG